MRQFESLKLTVEELIGIYSVEYSVKTIEEQFRNLLKKNLLFIYSVVTVLRLENFGNDIRKK